MVEAGIGLSRAQIWCVIRVLFCLSWPVLPDIVHKYGSKTTNLHFMAEVTLIGWSLPHHAFKTSLTSDSVNQCDFTRSVSKREEYKSSFYVRRYWSLNLQIYWKILWTKNQNQTFRLFYLLTRLCISSYRTVILN